MTLERLGFAVLVAAAMVCVVSSGFAAQPSDPPPSWAFPVNPPRHDPHAPAPDKLEHVAGSAMAYTDKQLNDEFFPTDWFPNEHPQAPRIVLQGRKPAAMPCALCHLPTGTGGPAEAALPGLPAGYIIEQVLEFRAGRRHCAEPKMRSVGEMELEAKAVSMAELQEAAQYFSHLTFKSHFHVVESDIAPKASVKDISLYVKIPGGGSEPLGQRIVEVPDDSKQWELGNPHTEFTAYVPKGSIRRGEALVASGAGAAPCASCHGPGLKGTAIAPPLAGRSPSYIVRQLYDIQYGARSGPTVALMVPEVAHMKPDERIAIAAYIGSLKP